MKKRKAQIEKEISKVERLLRKQPPGKLYCAYNGKYIKWYHKQDGIRRYISKHERQLAEKLAIKHYLSLQRKDLLYEKEAINLYLKKREQSLHQADTLLEESSKFKPLLENYITSQAEQLTKWEDETFQTNPYKPELLIHKTFSNRMVRSKSEVIIDNVLFTNQIPFRYEAKLVLKDRVVYPDFTICHPRTRKIFYWEHLGMMDNPSYVADNADKLNAYVRSGIYPNINLITTYETKDTPLTLEVVQEIVDFYFG